MANIPETRPVPADAAEQVAALPRRTAHAAYALYAWINDNMGPARTSEVVVYDKEALDARSTGRALAAAKRVGLVDYWGSGLWTLTPHGRDLAGALEDRFLRETEC